MAYLRWESIRNGAMCVHPGSCTVLAQLTDSFVLWKARAATEGRLRIALIAGTAISHDTQEFFDCCAGHRYTRFGDFFLSVSDMKV